MTPNQTRTKTSGEAPRTYPSTRTKATCGSLNQDCPRFSHDCPRGNGPLCCHCCVEASGCEDKCHKAECKGPAQGWN